MQVVAPWVDITKREVVTEEARRWNSEHDEAFAEEKRLSTNAPVLYFPAFLQDFVVQADASSCGARSFLSQKRGDDLAIIAYFGQRFQPFPTTLFCDTQGMLCRCTSNTVMVPSSIRVFTTFGIPEKLHSEQVQGFENHLVYQLRTVQKLKKHATQSQSEYTQIYTPC